MVFYLTSVYEYTRPIPRIMVGEGWYFLYEKVIHGPHKTKKEAIDKLEHFIELFSHKVSMETITDDNF
jgi:hypothetical protein